jgi:predicted MPP superfamily phosphohydrolase
VGVQVDQATTRAPEKKQKEHDHLRKQLKNAKTNLRAETGKYYFFQIHDKIMKRQLQRHLDNTAVEEDVEDIENLENIEIVNEY